MAQINRLILFPQARKLCTNFFRCFQTKPQTVTTWDINENETFKAADLHIELTKYPKPKPPTESLFFGLEFSDHMLSATWTKGENWSSPAITPIQNVSIHPGAKVLQYCAQCFEGLKAFRGYDNKIRLFRPMDNMNRFLSSAERAGLPSFDPEELLKCIKKLVLIDESWIPEATPDIASSLYIRPTLIATQPTLGVDVSSTALMYVVIGPCGPYYRTGFKPIGLLADPRYIRAWKGGIGCYKMGANYAPTIHVQKRAVEEGCSQILWLFGEDEELTEVGSMNLFVYLINEDGEKELLTAPTDSGLILPGVTRQSVLELTRKWGEFKVSERKFTMKDLMKAFKEKRVIEIMGSGTAVVVCPVDKIKYHGEWYHIPSDNKLVTRLYNELLGIQYGTIPSDWMIDLE